MNTSLVSLREAAGDLNTGNYQLRADVELCIGNDVTRWVLELDAQRLVYDTDGRLLYFVFLARADIEIGEGEPPPEVLWSYAPLDDLDVITRVFGVDLDARIWTRGSKYARE